MPTNAAYLAAELREWPSKDRMASILRSAGLRVSVGTYSIRLDDFSHFVFNPNAAIEWLNAVAAG